MVGTLRKLYAVALTACSFPGQGLVAESPTYLIKTEKLYTASHGVIDHGMLLTSRGKIVAVGRNLRAPAGAEVLEARAAMPGLVDIHAHIGLKEINQIGNPITPEFRALDVFDPTDPSLREAMRGGVTTIIARPGSHNVIGGVSVAVKLKDAPKDQMILEEVADLKMAFNVPGRYPAVNTVSAQYHAAATAFRDAREYQQRWQVYEQQKSHGSSVMPPARDSGLEHLVKVLNREIPVHLHCGFPSSVLLSCIKLADEFNFRLTLGHVFDGYMLTPQLLDRKDIHFNGVAFAVDAFDRRQFKNAAAIMANAGLKVSFHNDAPGVNQALLLSRGALLARYGMKEDDVIRGLTINSAAAGGLNDRVGSLEAGKDADVVLLDGEPLELTTSIQKVLIDGKIEYARPSTWKKQPAIASTQARGSLELPATIDRAASFAIKGGTVLTLAGPPLESAVVWVRDGRIEEVGRDVSLPPGTPVIDAEDYVIMPGIVSPRSSMGTEVGLWRTMQPDASAMTPSFDVKYEIDPLGVSFAWSRAAGITTGLVAPPVGAQVVGGRGAVVKTNALAIDAILIKEKAVMLFAIGSAGTVVGDQMPSTRVQIKTILQGLLTDAQRYRQTGQAPAGLSRDQVFSLQALVPVVAGELTALFHCETAEDVATAIALVDEFHLKSVITDALGAYRQASDLAKRGIPVVLDDVLLTSSAAMAANEYSAEAASALHRAGVRVAIASYVRGNGPFLMLSGAEPLEAAAFAYKNGLPEETALRAITTEPARILGVQDRVGSLEPGKDADILILRGHPFALHSVPELVLVDGRIAYRRVAGEMTSLDAALTSHP